MSQKTVWTAQKQEELEALYLSGKTYIECSKHLGLKPKFVRNCIEDSFLKQVSADEAQRKELQAKYSISDKYYASMLSRRQRYEIRKAQKEELLSMTQEQRKEFYAKKRQERNSEREQEIVNSIPEGLTVQDLYIALTQVVKVLNKNRIRTKITVKGVQIV